MTYVCEINEYQRKALVDAMRARIMLDANGLAKLPGDVMDNGLEEAELFLAMLEELPKVEAENPKVLHGLCL